MLGVEGGLQWFRRAGSKLAGQSGRKREREREREARDRVSRTEEIEIG